MRVPAALARAALNEARADYGAVARALLPLTQPWAREWVNQPGFWPWADVYANALVVLGRHDEADEFLRPHEQSAAEAGHLSATARLAYARGRWHGLQGDLDAARASFDRALELLEPMPLRYDRARVHFSYGQTLRRAGRRAEADAVMSAARDAYLALGAQTYVARCDRELAAGGVNVVRANREFDDLTPQEEAVASLVAQGRSNKEVAAELFLSVKTVQYHLTRIYAKLGIRSRSELAARRAGDAS
jgi:DNA-binding CsgD family transcriptional regulator